ncbi:SNF1-related kinase regulatory subunit gamma-like PV42a [Olea europaea subsp. europaea]|uniref:SNF1-related kinase regulatory subunit gamma-like PV42a n=1 Tax=Olea europaea subsp. europaea TaxID=158383 RepID=A0A8S0TXE6_OLEEU|nr:SNF1-related kinase regulatory subunit gamma-like PV42a [Olea europaea subsp. europaea]
MQMQATEIEQIHGSIHQPYRLRDKKVSDLIPDKRRLVEVPYTASLADTINALMNNRISAVAVVAPPGNRIGAGGSMILEADKHTGEVRKHYIGMMTMLDILAQIAGNHVEPESDGDDLDQKMKVSVSSITGRCLESLSLWSSAIILGLKLSSFSKFIFYFSLFLFKTQRIIYLACPLSKFSICPLITSDMVLIFFLEMRHEFYALITTTKIAKEITLPQTFCNVRTFVAGFDVAIE